MLFSECMPPGRAGALHAMGRPGQDLDFFGTSTAWSCWQHFQPCGGSSHCCRASMHWSARDNTAAVLYINCQGDLQSRHMLQMHAISSSGVRRCSSHCTPSTFQGSSIIQLTCSHDSSLSPENGDSIHFTKLFEIILDLKHLSIYLSNYSVVVGRLDQKCQGWFFVPVQPWLHPECCLLLGFGAQHLSGRHLQSCRLGDT